MLAKVISCAVVGLEGAIVEVEVDISPGLPSFTIVGLPDADAKEASLIEGAKILPVTSLSHLVSYFRGEIPLPECKFDEVEDYIPPVFSTTNLVYLSTI